MTHKQIEEFIKQMCGDLVRSISVDTATGDDLGKIAVTMHVQPRQSIEFLPFTVNIGGDCQHEFVDYVGLNEGFTFCKKCDKKQGES